MKPPRMRIFFCLSRFVQKLVTAPIQLRVPSAGTVRKHKTAIIMSGVASAGPLTDL